MPETIYILCALTSIACMTMLVRAYRQTRVRLLLWSSLCFAGLALNNVLLVVDFLIGPLADLSTARTIPALIGVLGLLGALVWERA